MVVAVKSLRVGTLDAPRSGPGLVALYNARVPVLFRLPDGGAHPEQPGRAGGARVGEDHRDGPEGPAVERDEHLPVAGGGERDHGLRDPAVDEATLEDGPRARPGERRVDGHEEALARREVPAGNGLDGGAG